VVLLRLEDVGIKIPYNKEGIVDNYDNIRLELNKLCYSSHKCIGITMDPLSFVMEYTPLGSFRKILKAYREAKYNLCPVSVLLSIQQVCVHLCSIECVGIVYMYVVYVCVYLASVC